MWRVLTFVLISAACAPAEAPAREPAAAIPRGHALAQLILGPRVIVRRCDPSPSETYAPFEEYRVTRLADAEVRAAGCLELIGRVDPCIRGRVVLRGKLYRHTGWWDQDPTEKSFGEAVREAQRKPPPLWAVREVPPDAYGARLRAAVPVEDDTHYDGLADCIAPSALALYFETDEPVVDLVYSVSERRFLNVFE